MMGMDHLLQFCNILKDLETQRVIGESLESCKFSNVVTYMYVCGILGKSVVIGGNVDKIEVPNYKMRRHGFLNKGLAKAHIVK